MDKSDEEIRVEGECPICEKPVEFSGIRGKFRDTFVCSLCRSIPRERALFLVLKTLYPNWRDLHIHESSPIRRGGSERLRKECSNYSFSQYDPSIPHGTIHPQQKHRSEDLENLTFEDDTFDAIITQDVFEHLFRPDIAAKEIARTLKVGGAHILTTPLVHMNRPSQRRCRLDDDGNIVNLLPPVFHGNPMSSSGSIVTVDWGYDILEYLTHHGGTASTMFVYDDLERGLRAPLIEVIVCSKNKLPSI